MQEQIDLPAIPTPVSEAVYDGNRRWIARACNFLAVLGVVAFVGSVPGLQLCLLGYLLTSSRLAARGGRIQAGLVGARPSWDVLAAAVAAAVWLLCALAVHFLGKAMTVVDPTLNYWRMGLEGAAAFVALLQVAGGLLQGGGFRGFFTPYLSPGRFRKTFCSDHFALLGRRLRNLMEDNPFVDYWWSGLRCSVGSAAWLAPSAVAILVGRDVPSVGYAGVLLLGFTAAVLPALQTHFAVEDRGLAMLDLKAALRAWSRKPLTFLLGTSLLLGLTVPCFALRLESPPWWSLGLPIGLMVAAALPGRLLLGVAYGRAQRTEIAARRRVRWPAYAAAFLVSTAYAGAVVFAQYIVWDGTWSLVSQHSLILPIPNVRSFLPSW